MIIDPYDKFQVGDVATISHHLTAQDVDAFAKLTGDNNPLHMSDQYAATTSFKERVVHGMLSASFISTIIGTKIPGEGALWLSQTLSFHAPARIGDNITVNATLKHKSDSQRIFVIWIEVVDQNARRLISGESQVQLLSQSSHQKNTLTNISTTQPNRGESANSIRVEAGETKVALITGASGGIGAEISRKLSEDGYDVVLHYNSSEEKAAQLQNEIVSKGRRAYIYRADICDEEQVKEMASFVSKKVGGISVLVNNASKSIEHKAFADLTWEDIQNHLDVQVKGSYNTCKSFIPVMEKLGKGKIVNMISTVVDNVPPVKTYDYALAKSALSSFSKSLAAEFGPKNIQVNCVSPGMTNTSLIANFPERAKMVTAMQTPLRRLAEPHEVANIVSFLASENANYLTGETIRVCGGQNMF